MQARPGLSSRFSLTLDCLFYNPLEYVLRGRNTNEGGTFPARREAIDSGVASPIIGRDNQSEVIPYMVRRASLQFFAKTTSL